MRWKLRPSNAQAKLWIHPSANPSVGPVVTTVAERSIPKSRPVSVRIVPPSIYEKSRTRKPESRRNSAGRYFLWGNALLAWL